MSLANMLTSIQNAQKAQLSQATVPYSKLKRAVAEILYNEGYVSAVEEIDCGNGKLQLVIKPKYLGKHRKGAIRNIKLYSKGSCRVYIHKNSQAGYSGMAVRVLSTNHGVMTSLKANKLGIGGEHLFDVL